MILICMNCDLVVFYFPILTVLCTTVVSLSSVAMTVMFLAFFLPLCISLLLYLSFVFFPFLFA
jgi:hypothetical protein